MEITATAKNIRISPQKVRIVVEEIKKTKPQEAVALLDFVAKSAAQPLKKVIASAIANAKNNLGLDAKTLVFKSIQVGGGRSLKRFRAVSRGRSHAILKRTSHIKVVLVVEKNKTNKSNMSSVSNIKEIEGSAHGSKS